MPTGYRQAQRFLETLLHTGSREELTQRLEPTQMVPAKRLGRFALSLAALDRRWNLFQSTAEVRAALALAGELSMTAALCAGEFARAQQKLARGRTTQ